MTPAAERVLAVLPTDAAGITTRRVVYLAALTDDSAVAALAELERAGLATCVAGTLAAGHYERMLARFTRHVP
jgi:hypothetical protein